MNVPSILIIEDEVEVGRFFRFLLEEEKGYKVTVSNSAKNARLAVDNQEFNLAIIDVKLPDANGIDLLKEIKDKQPNCQVIIITGHGSLRLAINAIKLGAFDYIEKPFTELEDLEETIERALQLGSTYDCFDNSDIVNQEGIIFAWDSPMRDILNMAKKIAPKNINVLIEGETGTGKELLANFIHNNSLRAGNIFYPVNCSAFSETLLESELFGHEKGSFTGAHNSRKGIFEISNGGTIFLDELGEATPAIQKKLLRIIETKEYTRVGGETIQKCDVRIIAATNKDLRHAVKKGLFREDLLYRLDVVNIELPPLRNRPNDIALLVNYFIEKNMGSDDNENVKFTKTAMDLLKAYSWPGNIRELANVVLRALALKNSCLMGVELLPDRITGIPSKLLKDVEVMKQRDMLAIVNTWGEILPDLLKDFQEIDVSLLIDCLKNANNDILKQVINNFKIKYPDCSYSQLSEKMGLSSRSLRYLLKERK